MVYGSTRERISFYRHPNQHGFTLLDLLIVIMILALLGAVVVPRLQSMVAETTLNEAAMEVVSALQYAAGLAIEYQRPFGLRAEVAENRFSVFDKYPYPDDTATVRLDNTPPVNAADIVLDPLTKTWYTRDFDTLSTYEGVAFSSVPPGEEIRFWPDGHSSESDNTFVLTYAGMERTITVNGATGRIRAE